MPYGWGHVWDSSLKPIAGGFGFFWESISEFMKYFFHEEYEPYLNFFFWMTYNAKFAKINLFISSTVYERQLWLLLELMEFFYFLYTIKILCNENSSAGIRHTHKYHLLLSRKGMNHLNLSLVKEYLVNSVHFSSGSDLGSLLKRNNQLLVYLMCLA